MKAEMITKGVGGWRPELLYNHQVKLNVNELHPKVTIVVTHPGDEIKALSNALEGLDEGGIEVRILYVTGARSQIHESEALDKLLPHIQPEIIYLDYPINDLCDYELELARFLISFCDDTSIFLAPDENGSSEDHESCACAATVAACRLNADLIQYQLDTSLHSLSMYRFSSRIKELKTQKKTYIAQNMFM